MVEQLEVYTYQFTPTSIGVFEQLSVAAESGFDFFRIVIKKKGKTNLICI